ncbi:MAG: tRNA pseudouridine(55) synthase TruB [Deltaproteobacteria bacterium]|nr:tRNA pseudouridine(55) synthase TruB [Deltaproteobacteria bacterium]
MDGILLIDKPSGPTSFDIVRAVRRAANERKVGHAGTLDPLASGLLVVGIRQGTKLIQFLMDSEKRYLAEVALGDETDTDDALGVVTQEKPVPSISRDMLEDTLAGFIGKIKQTPPKYSALKEGGEPLYRKARRGENVTPKTREVEIRSIELTDLSERRFSIDVRCGKGTYIRALARDVARSLGTLGHLTALRRIETSGFRVDEAMPLADLESASKHERLVKKVISLAEALPALPKIILSPEDETKIRHGQPMLVAEVPKAIDLADGTHVSLLTKENNLCAIARLDGDQLRPVRGIT